MPPPSFVYVPYGASRRTPNVVVDGAANESTVLTLSHWPGVSTPAFLAADLSTEIAFRYLTGGVDQHGEARAVTNNHFDQDGVAGIAALVDPNWALEHRDLLEDVASAGDFATFRDRRAAKIAMVLEAWADPERSPFAPLLDDPEDRCEQLHREALSRFAGLVDNVDAHQSMWGDEHARMRATERLLADGRVEIAERPDLDVSVVTVDDRTGSAAWDPLHHLHPMAIHNAIAGLACLYVSGRRYRFAYRYESWVQLTSRPVRLRRDLADLAGKLTGLETAGATWVGEPASQMTPELRIDAGNESSLDPGVVLDALADHLLHAPVAWDPSPQR